jgi:hypothetical protein
MWCNKYVRKISIEIIFSLTLRKEEEKINFRPHSSLDVCPLRNVANLYQSHTLRAMLNLFHVNFL